MIYYYFSYPTFISSTSCQSQDQDHHHHHSKINSYLSTPPSFFEIDSLSFLEHAKNTSLTMNEQHENKYTHPKKNACKQRQRQWKKDNQKQKQMQQILPKKQQQQQEQEQQQEQQWNDRKTTTNEVCLVKDEQQQQQQQPQQYAPQLHPQGLQLQRMMNEEKRLQYRKEKITGLTPSWLQSYRILETYQKTHGHVDVPQNYVHGKERKASRGRRYDESNSSTIANIEESDHTKKNKECNAVASSGFKLGIWVKNQRRDKRCRDRAIFAHTSKSVALTPVMIVGRFSLRGRRVHAMTDEREKMLTVLDFIWDPGRGKGRRRNTRVVAENLENDGIGIGIDDSQKNITTAIRGNNRTTRKESWSMMMNELRAFQKIHGHVDVPASYLSSSSSSASSSSSSSSSSLTASTSPVKLANWVKANRKEYSRMFNIKTNNTLSTSTKITSTRLTLNRISSLESLGFKWSTRNDSWNKKYDELISFKECYGHLDVPTTMPGALKLLSESLRSSDNKTKVEVVVKSKINGMKLEKEGEAKSIMHLGIWLGLQRCHYRELRKEKGGKETLSLWPQLFPFRGMTLKRAKSLEAIHFMLENRKCIKE